MSNKTKIMGILNVTPDSFFDQGKWSTFEKAVQRALILCQEGADILDVGGESTRPGAEEVSERLEIQRVIPVIQELKKKISIPISIDTMKPAVAKAALEAGASFINDVTGFCDSKMVHIALEAKADICVMHMQGTPRTMQESPHYPEGIVSYLINWFSMRIEELLKRGIEEKRIVLDPGIGFGKTVAHNLEIIHNLPQFKTLGFPLLLGVSRKSFLSKILDKPANDLLAATLAVNTKALLEGVDYLRVHDVAEHRMVVDFFSKSSALIKKMECSI